eukprot:CAMPEP_0118978096 /NCGR_PEP_ID=MMETSP1173-20130426/22876_1 /TAXON_ID=1034831 /ORGANISM="Rhizochromulina marina cf, Strain CCMP1243" /LENGTH=71 /DNA_ID=CAMNT_0006928265 /DNA_START=42 /DNA_END=257 /DNA_ORIENTATION=-
MSNKSLSSRVTSNKILRGDAFHDMGVGFKVLSNGRLAVSEEGFIKEGILCSLINPILGNGKDTMPQIHWAR